MNPYSTGTCWNCGQRLNSSDYAREATCPGCRKSTHVCRNCSFFAPGKPNDCREPLVERVTDKDRANFCGYFEPADTSAASKQSSPDDLLKAAQDLFKT